MPIRTSRKLAILLDVALEVIQIVLNHWRNR